MEINRDETIQAVNAFIETQKNTGVDDDCKFTLATFDHTYKIIINNISIDKVKPVTKRQYKPNGCTALYDAIGAVITQFSTSKKVILVIITDGQENTSRKYSRLATETLINKYKKIWNIIYLSADPMLTVQGNEIGIKQETNSSTSNCYTNFKTLSNYSRLKLGKAVSDFRKGENSYINISP